MHFNLNITLWFPRLDTGAQTSVQYSLWGLSKIWYIFLTTFTSLEILFLTIQPIIQSSIKTINKIWESVLNITSKPISKSYSSFFFFLVGRVLFGLIYKFIFNLRFLDTICSSWSFSNFNFEVSSQYAKLFKSIRVFFFFWWW